MPGPYSNEDGCYLKDDNWENGHWYEDPQGNLYIVPIDEDEISGPDTANLDRLYAAYHGEEVEAVDPYEIGIKLGLDVIPDVLKRFDPDTGYYHA